MSTTEILRWGLGLVMWLVILAVVALIALITVSPEPAEPASHGGDEPPSGGEAG